MSKENILKNISLPEGKEILKIDTGKGIHLPHKIYDLVSERDPILSTPTIPFDWKNHQIDPVFLATSLFETMFKHKGLGLSANQVGIPYRVFVVGFDSTNKQVFFNPRIKQVSTETVLDTEGCLSYPHLFLKIKRPKWIILDYEHVTGEKKENQRYDGLTCRVICHEMDHMDGYDFTSRVGKLSLQMAKDKRRKTLKKVLKNDRK